MRVPILIEVVIEMELVRIDTQKAYDQIKEEIISLKLPPGQPIDEQQLGQRLDLGQVPVREALKLLAHDDLVVITPHHGLYVADVNIPDLERISEMRLSLETLCARLAAERASDDDLTVLDALCLELPEIPSKEYQKLLDLDHRFHRAMAQATQNRYLAKTLDHFLRLSQRLWYLALPRLGFLPAAVEDHLRLVEAIETGDADRAEAIMRDHVGEFYNEVREILADR
jgi:DNA-binding GntR family transcriptional regulator